MTATPDGADGGFSASVNKLMSDTGATLQSGYRNSQQQQALYDQAVKEHGKANASHWAAEPGHSNHESGFAADIGNWQNITDAQLAQYGLHRPMSWEPWHVEPIGYKAGSAKAYTKPRAADPKVTQVMDNVAPALDQLFRSVGTQVSGVDEQASGVDALATGMSAPPMAAMQPSIPTVGTVAATTSDAMDMDRFMGAISGQESGGNYNAKNKDSGAFGKYQIMPANWSSWAQAAGLDANAPQTPQNQDKVARNQFQRYYEQFGNWHDVAVAWYAGPNAVGKQSGNASQGAYPTINKYANNIVNRMNS